jgi:hypothetical protein
MSIIEIANILEILKNNRNLKDDSEIKSFYLAYDNLCTLPFEYFDSTLFLQLITIFDDKIEERRGLYNLASFIEQTYNVQRNPKYLWDNLKANFKLFYSAKEYFSVLLLGIINEETIVNLIFNEVNDKTEYGKFLCQTLKTYKEDGILNETFSNLSCLHI